MRTEILQAARTMLTHDGPANLSFRAVARSVGLASSAVYRYFPSREALLTSLIIESYDDLGNAVDAAEEAVPRTAYAERYRVIARAVRAWGLAEKHQWLLIFGSPIPGYEAPADTMPAATRVPRALSRVLREAWLAGAVKPGQEVFPEVHDALEIRDTIGEEVPDQILVRGLVAWTYVLGAVITEVFGHRLRVVASSGADAVFERELDEVASLLGITGSPRRPGALIGPPHD